MKRAAMPLLAFVCFCAMPAAQVPGTQAAAPVTAIRAGRLLDPDAGVIRANQIILIQGNRIREVGPNVAIPAGAQVIDLSKMTVMPGLVDAHNHLALTYKPGSREQHLLLHVRAGVDAAAGDSGSIERHPDARVRFHHRPRHG
jgi:imidazolonepropionase-like amidohydrolase